MITEITTDDLQPAPYNFQLHGISAFNFLVRLTLIGRPLVGAKGQTGLTICVCATVHRAVATSLAR
jgi:hypothetical protein